MYIYTRRKEKTADDKQLMRKKTCYGQMKKQAWEIFHESIHDATTEIIDSRTSYTQ